MKKKNEVWLNLGCGVSLAEDFINVDNFFTLEDLKNGEKTKEGIYKNARVPKGVEFVQADLRKLPFVNEFADYIECNDVIEHMAQIDVPIVLKEIYRVLKPGGKLALGTTNFNELAKLWTENISNSKFETQKEWDSFNTLTQVIYGNQAGPGEFHKSPFNPFILGFHLQLAGFNLKNIVINVYPTNSPYIAPQKAYKFFEEKIKGTVVLTEMLFAECIK